MEGDTYLELLKTDPKSEMYGKVSISTIIWIILDAGTTIAPGVNNSICGGRSKVLQVGAQRCETGELPPLPCGMSLIYEFTADEIIREGRTTRKNIDELKEWLKRENLPKATDEQIVIFLLSCQNDVGKTEQTMMSYYKCTHNGPNIFNDRDVLSKELSHQITVVDSCVIPRRTKENYLIVFQRLKNFSYWNFHLETSMKYLFMTLDLGLQKNPPDGLIVLFDMKGLGLMHLTKLRVGPLKIFFQFLQEGLPVQIQDIHVFNSAYFVDKLIAIIKPFMKKELYEKLHFHQSSLNMEDFFTNCVEAECVPSDYGGKLPSVKTLDEISLAKLKQMNPWFEAEEKLRKNYKPPK